MDRMKTLLESYYGVGSSRDEDPSLATNLDSASFDKESYVKDRLEKSSFAELLRMDDSLVHEVRTLDADVQLLVYDNYSKFIDATDTIRSMKDKINEIETEVDALASRVENVHNKTLEVNERMRPKRSRIEKLVRLQSLIQKLNFLFELPLRLRQCIEMDAASQAVQYYQRAVPILQKHAEVTSFAAIQKESEEIILQLRSRLRDKINEPSLTFDSFNESLSLLIELSEGSNFLPSSPSETLDKDSLRDMFFVWHERHFDNQIKRTLELQSNLGLEGFVAEICSRVLDDLRSVCQMYKRLFCLGEDNEEEAILQLRGFAKPVLSRFLNTVRSRLVADDVMYGGALEGDAGTLENDSKTLQRSGNTKKDAGQFSILLGALDVFVRHMRESDLSGVVRPSFFRDRATEVAEHVIRNQVVLAFDQLHANVNRRLIALYDAHVHKEKMLHASPMLRAKELAAEIESDIAQTMMDLDALLRACSDLLADMSAIFDNLIKFQLRSWVLGLANAIECVCDPFHPARRSLSEQGKIALCANSIDGLNGGESYSSHAPSIGRGSRSMAPERTKILVDIPVRPGDEPGALLDLACLALQIRMYVRRCPYAIAGAPELMNELDATKGRLMLAYVEVNSGILSSDFGWIASSSASDSSKELSVRPFIVGIVDGVNKCSKQVALCTQDDHLFGPRRTESGIASGHGAFGGSGSTDFDSDMLGQSGRFMRSAGQGGANSGVHKDIERMFTRKVTLYEHVQLNVESVALNLLKVVLKTLFEITRESTFSRTAFQQFEIDLYFLRSTMPTLVEDVELPSTQLTQIMAASRDRCVDPVPLAQDVIDRACRASRSALRAQSEESEAAKAATRKDASESEGNLKEPETQHEQFE